MTDYISIEAQKKPTTLFWKGWKSKTDVEGREYYYSVGFYGLKFMSYNPTTNVTILKGSIHKLYNFVFRGLKNANYTQFTRTDLQDAINFIEDLTGIEAHEFKVKGYEFAINVLLEIIVQSFFLNNVVDYKQYSGDVEKHETPNYCYIFNKGRASEKEYKFYDKGAQARSRGITDIGNLLRIETKLKKRRVVNMFGVNTLSDLTNPDVWERQLEALKDQLKNLIILDTPEEYPQYNNPKVFERWRNKKGAKNRQARKRFFDALPHSELRDIILKEMELTYHNLYSLPS